MSGYAVSRSAAWPVSVSLLLITAVGCGGRGSGSAVIADELAPAPPTVAERVEVAQVRRGSIRPTITASGSVVARQETALGAEVSGRLLRVSVEVGDAVEAGGEVFVIDPRPYEIALREAEAGLELARAELSLAEEEVERKQHLAAQQVIAEQEYDRQRTQHAVAVARVSQASARVQRARQNLDHTVVRAPYDGSVVERRLHEGAMVAPGPGSAVVVLQERGKLEAILDVPEAAQVTVQPGDLVRLFVEESADVLEGRVEAVNARIDPESRTYEVRVPVREVDGSIKAGCFARGEITPYGRRNALVVDGDAVVTRDGRPYLFRVLGDSVEQVQVRLGSSDAGSREVLSGVSEGEEVVVGGVVGRLTAGSRIEVVARREPPPVSESERGGEDEDPWWWEDEEGGADRQDSDLTSDPPAAADSFVLDCRSASADPDRALLECEERELGR